MLLIEHSIACNFGLQLEIGTISCYSKLAIACSFDWRHRLTNCSSCCNQLGLSLDFSIELIDRNQVEKQEEGRQVKCRVERQRWKVQLVFVRSLLSLQ